VNTLLSIPFSILFNVPRLAGLITSTNFRLDLLGMAVEIQSLWAWDPEISTNTPISVSNTQRSPPRPIYDASRDTTFAGIRPLAPNAALISAEPASSSSRCVVQADSGAYVVGSSPQVRFQDGALTTVPPDHDANTVEKEPICHTTSHVMATSLNRSVSLCGSMQSTPVSELECDNSNDELKLDVVSLQARVTAWLEDLDKHALDPLPADVNDTRPFIPGCMGGMTANDILMVKGCINPSVYIHFFDLSLHA
jgi:hypothetical protein